jgi:hypothetical protein
MRVYLLSIALTILFTGCDPTDNRFIIINSRSNTVCFYFSRDSSYSSAIEFYSDKFYTISEENSTKKDFDYVKSGESKHVQMIGSWENYINNQFKNGVAYIYTIDSFNIGKEVEMLKESNFIKQYKVTSKLMHQNQWVLKIE